MFELLRIAVRGAAAAALACAGTLLLATVLPVAFGWGSQIVLTGSMRPGIAPGDLVVSAPVAPALVRPGPPGQVVVVDNPARPGTRLVHRVVRRNADGSFTTKGDANPSEDSAAVPEKNVRGMARLRTPKVGLPMLWLHEGRRVPVLAVFAVLTGLGWLARAAERTGTSTETSTGTSTRTSTRTTAGSRAGIRTPRHARRKGRRRRVFGRTLRQHSRPDPHPGIRSDLHRATDLVSREVL